MTTPFFLIEDTETLAMSGLSSEEYILLNSVSDGVTVNSQGIFSYVNTTFAEMVGYSVSELLGMNILKLTAPEYVDLISERSSKRQQGLEVVSIYELELVRKDGTCFPVELSISRIDFDGKSSNLTIVRDKSERKQAEKELVESEERYRGLFDSLIDGFAYHRVVYSDDGKPVDYRYIDINERFTELVGLDRDIIGKTVTEVLPGIENSPADWIGVYGKLATDGGELRFEQYAEPLDKWFKVSAFSSKKGYFATIFQDITEQRLTEMDLLLVNQLNEAVNKGASLQEIINLLSQGSQSNYRSMGASVYLMSDDKSILELQNLVLPEDLEGVIKRIIGREIPKVRILLKPNSLHSEIIERGEPRLINDAQTIKRMMEEIAQNQILRRFASRVFKVIGISSVMVTPLVSEGEVIGLMDISRKTAFKTQDLKRLGRLAAQISNIINRKRLEDKLEESEERYRAFSESASESFVLFDSELNMVNINTIGVERLGITKEEVLGRPMLEIMPQLKGSKRYERYLDVLTTGEPQIFDVVNHFTGIRLLRINAFKVRDGLGIIATDLSELLKEQEERERIFEELTAERIRSEQEHELGLYKTRFMSTATHEIRTPLSSILGYTELIQNEQETLSERQRRYFEVIIRNVNRLTILTDDLMDQQRLEEGKLSMDRELVKISELVEAVRIEFVPLIDRKSQTLQVNCVDTVLNIDRLRVMQVLVNLLSNASKFSPVNGVIVIDVVETDDYVQVCVSDNGVGFHEEDLSKLFTPFPGILVDGNVTGSGLGLSICKGIVELHGGTIWGESGGLGNGSRFSFTLPILDVCA